MMKRSNFSTLLLLVLSVFLVMSSPNGNHSLLSWAGSAFSAAPRLPHIAEASDRNKSLTDTAPASNPPTNFAESQSSTQIAEPQPSTQIAEPANRENNDTFEAKAAPLSMEHTLLIGDSRTVGLLDYGQIKEADYFCSVGMSVFNVQTETVSVPGTGKITLNELLENKSYKRVYVMLGINELGYPFEDIISKYSELIGLIKENEPDAAIFLQANLHVTKKRSDRDDIYNNTRINELNHALSEFADQETIFYIDANELFDDSDGALAADKSADGTHPYGKYYVEWAEWMVQKTADVPKEE